MNGRIVRWLLAHATPMRAYRGPARLTIVRHHRVYADGEFALNRLGVAAGVLEGQVASLDRAGLTPVTVSEGLRRLRAGQPGHHVAFSFDDGYLDNLTRAVPILTRYGARATFYLTAGLMGSRVAPWWDELVHALEHARTGSIEWRGDGPTRMLELGTADGRAAALGFLLPQLRVPPAEQRVRLDRLRAATGVTDPAPCELATWEEARGFGEAQMEVGAHTMNHPFLSLLPAHEQRAEIGESITEIRGRLGIQPVGLAYPNGDHDDRTVEAARACGLEHAVLTRAGDARPGVDAFRIPRRGLPDGACLDPAGRYSDRLTLAEIRGVFDGIRPAREEAPA